MKEEIGNDGELYGYVFHYNHYRKMWYAIPRDEYVDYWTGTSGGAIAHEDMGTLLRIIFEDYHAEE